MPPCQATPILFLGVSAHFVSLVANGSSFLRALCLVTIDSLVFFLALVGFLALLRSAILTIEALVKDFSRRLREPLIRPPSREAFTQTSSPTIRELHREYQAALRQL